MFTPVLGFSGMFDLDRERAGGLSLPLGGGGERRGGDLGGGALSSRRGGEWRRGDGCLCSDL